MLEVRSIYKGYESLPLLKGVSFTVAQKETLCLLGPSGSGKSTLLRIIAGLELPENGEILWYGEDLKDTPVHKRNFGLMFQDYALFPHRNVAENVAFGLRMQSLPPAEIETRVREALAQVNMLSFTNRRVTDLSGGEQQRVALARALAPRPPLLMLDEPLGSLDRTLREQLLEELRQLLHMTGIPTIYVTHDQEEAFSIADRIILLFEGQVVQAGTPAEVYNNPASPWVARFLGLINLLSGEVISTGPLRLQTRVGILESSVPVSNDLQPGHQTTLLLRPSGARLHSGEPSKNCIKGIIEDVVFRGEMYSLSIRCEPDLCFQFYMDHPLAVEKLALLCLESDSILCLE